MHNPIYAVIIAGTVHKYLKTLRAANAYVRTWAIAQANNPATIQVREVEIDIEAMRSLDISDRTILALERDSTYFKLSYAVTHNLIPDTRNHNDFVIGDLVVITGRSPNYAGYVGQVRGYDPNRDAFHLYIPFDPEPYTTDIHVMIDNSHLTRAEPCPIFDRIFLGDTPVSKIEWSAFVLSTAIQSKSNWAMSASEVLQLFRTRDSAKRELLLDTLTDPKVNALLRDVLDDLDEVVGSTVLVGKARRAAIEQAVTRVKRIKFSQ